MSITMRLSSILAASALAATVGLATGLTIAPAAAGGPVGPGDVQVCTQDCGPEPEEPEPWGPGGFQVCTEDCGPDEPETGGESVDTPIPADANFTG
jgi:hypothetical protein